MSERERMEAGALYRFAGDAELMAMGARSRRLTRQYNATREDEGDRRRALLEELFGSVGEGAHVEPPLHCDYGCNVHAGARFFANFGLIVLDECRVAIGDDVMIGPRVSLCCAGHPIDAAVRTSGLEYGKPITIGNNVWIGAHTVVNPGVTIGDNTVIGSGSVVTKDVPANVVAAGNPCRVLRPITAEDAARWEVERDAYFRAVAAEAEG